MKGKRIFLKRSSKMEIQRLQIIKLEIAKIRVCRSAFRPWVTYATETISSTRKNKENLRVFVKKVISGIQRINNLGDKEF